MEKSKNIDLYALYSKSHTSKWDISTASVKRSWMNEYGPFIYRCLPLAIANQNGWVVKSPCDITAIWDGQTSTDSMTFELGEGYSNEDNWVSCYFGGGIITFIFDFFIKTTEKTNLLVRGAPNFYVDGAHALEGLVETDWLNFTFTMNWKVINPNKYVYFKKGDPICFLQPVPHNYSEEFNFNVRQLQDYEDLQEKFNDNSQSRGDFILSVNKKHREGIKVSANDSWQKHYFEGIDVSSNTKVPSDVHAQKLNLSKPEKV